jgi:hypothetical protein
MKKILILSLVVFAIGCSKKSSDDDISFDGTLTINNASSLDQAITFGNQVSTLSGDLTITTGGSTGITSALVSQVTALITSVGGNVTVSSPDGPIDLSQLSSVGGNYSIEGSDANDDNLLTVDGDITLNYEGNYSMPNLTSAGRIFITPISTSTASKKLLGYSLSFPSIVLCNAIAISPIAAETIPTIPRALDLTTFIVNPIKSIDFGPGLIIEDLIAPAALDIVIKNPLPLAKLKIKAPLAMKVDIATTAVNGPINIQTSTDTGSTFSAPALATVQGDLVLTCGKADLNNLTVIQGNCAVPATTISAPSIASVAGNLTITSVGVSMPLLTTVGGNVSVTGTSSNSIVDFANLSNVGGETEIDANDVNLNTGQPHNSGGN